MISQRILLSLSAIIGALLLVAFTAMKISQPLHSNQLSNTKVWAVKDTKMLYEASQSALRSALTHNNVLPYPGILPNHPMYWLKMVRDKVKLITTLDQNKKLDLLINYADKRLASGQLLITGGDINLGISTITKAEKYLFQAAELSAKQNDSQRQTVFNHYQTHQLIIFTLKDMVFDKDQQILSDVYTNNQSIIDSRFNQFKIQDSFKSATPPSQTIQ